MNVIEKTTGDKAISNRLLQFLWLAVATVAATYAVYLNLLETRSGNSPFL